MWILCLYLLISILVPIIIGVASLIISSKFISSEGFECGFDSFNVRVFPVSLRFFIFCIIFLILDLELIIISITPIVIWSNGFIINIVIFFIFSNFKNINRMVIWKIKVSWVNWGWECPQFFIFWNPPTEAKLCFASNHPQFKKSCNPPRKSFEFVSPSPCDFIKLRYCVIYICVGDLSI